MINGTVKRRKRPTKKVKKKKKRKITAKGMGVVGLCWVPRKKRPLSSAKEKSRVKCRTKRRHFSSLISPDDATQTADDSEWTTCEPSKLYRISNARPTPFPLDEP